MPTSAADRVAIIVPCFNGARTLAETLDSALSQEGVGLEVVVIDDGSEDGSLAVARSYEPRVRVISGPNRGVSAARNTGIAETRAPWIVFLDADDWLEAGTLAKRLDIAQATDADVVITDWLDVIDDGYGRLCEDRHHTVAWDAIEAEAELATAVQVWATTAALLYSRRIVDKIGGFRSELPVIQDARFLFDAAFHGARFARADHTGARYRVLPGSLSRKNAARFWRDVLVSGRQIEALWRGSGRMNEARLQALADIYNNAVRGLFASADPAYFEAVLCQRALGLPLPRHSKLAAPLARLLGLPRARFLLSRFHT